MSDKKDQKQSTQTNTEPPKPVSQYPSEIIDLPSEGKIYPEGSPLRQGKVEVKYMTAKEEDILTSQNLIKKGLVIDQLLNSLILTPGVHTDDLYVGDKNAIMVAARILAYGADYTVEFPVDDEGQTEEHTFNLSELEYKKFPDELEFSGNQFYMTLPVSKAEITFKLLTGKDEVKINEEIKSFEKLRDNRQVTTRLRYMITSVNGDDNTNVINQFVNNMLAKDSLAFRKYWTTIAPDIILEQDIIREGGDEVTVDIPLTTNFFWPTD